MSEDWDDNATTSVSTTWNGGSFGSTLTNGDTGTSSFGGSKWQPSDGTVGRGRGRGGRGASNSDGGSFGSSGGRGGSSFGGFSNAATNGTSDDSTKFGGWGSSGSRGGNKSGGSGECYKCHETGHFARECPNADSSGGGRGGGSGECYKCHETGHFARDCPSAESSGGRGGGGGGECYKCHETGHFARECPNAESSGGRGGGGSGECYKCHETGHFARDCPNAESSGGRGGGGGGGGGECYKCHETGHFARECPNAESGGGRGGGGGGECYKCHETGHFARECPNAESGGGRGGGGGGECYKCHETGHFARECPNAESSGGGDRTCHKCNETGHFARECPSAEEGGESRPPPVTYIPPPPPEDEALIFESMQQGINFSKYDDIPVEVTGREPPRCLQCFEESDLSPQIKTNIAKAKYEKPTPVQKYGIPIIGNGRDLMACAQTGSGKTAAFLLPIINGMLNNGVTGSSFSEYQEPQCIIVSPTRELAIQIHKEAFKFSHGTVLRAVLAYGGTSKSYQLREIEKGCHLLVATPGRLMDFINSGRVRVGKCKYIVLDEADRMLDMGFGPEMQKLMDLPDMPKKGDRQCLMFSATFPNEVQEKAAEYLHDYLFLTVGRVGGATPDITQTILEVGQYDKREKLLEILDNRPENERVLVFLETKRSADFLATYLSQSQKSATSIHGDREQREREEALRDFRAGVAPILVATSVAARGLDITGVKHVVNYDLPSNIEEYVHRIGRTGRVGNLGQATGFYDPLKDSQLARALIKVLADAQQDVPEFLESAADSAVGTFHGNAGGSFGGRDTRKQFSGRGRGGGAGGGGSFGAPQDSWGSADAADVGGGNSAGGGSFATSSLNTGDDDSWD